MNDPGAPAFPVPVADADTAPFWAAAAERRLVIPRCRGCGHWIWQPKPVCPRCHTDGPQWTQIAGRGSVVSWTVVYPPVLPAFAAMVPFVILLVEVLPGVRLVGYLATSTGEVARHDGRALGVGAAVSLHWHDQAGVTLPVWSLAGADAPASGADDPVSPG